MYTLIAQENTKKELGEGGLMVTKETSMEKHRRLMAQAREISEYAQIHGPLEAMYRYDISMPQTLEKILKKGGKCEKLPLISKRAMYSTNQDYYDGIIQGLINCFVKMQNTLSERDQTIEGLRAEIDELTNKLHDRSAIDMIRQEKKFSEIVRLIEG